MNYTPRPWHNPDDSVSVFVGKGKDRQKVCDTYWMTINVKEARANARLIATAPDLLEALQAVLDRVIPGCKHEGFIDPIDDPYVQYARTVIAKALGQPV